MVLHAAFLLGALCQAAVLHAQTPPFDVATAMSADVEPVERTFEITQSGQYRLTLTDLGALLPAEAPLISGNVLVTRGTTVVTSVSTSTEPDSDVDTVDFDATAGTYKVHIVGKPGTELGSGPVSVRVGQVGNTTQALEMGATLSPPARLQPGVATFQTEIDVPAGSYELSVNDLNFPSLVQLAGAFLVRLDGMQPGTPPSLDACVSIPAAPLCPVTRTATLGQGRYTLILAGSIPASSEGGIFNVKLRVANGGPIIFSRSVEMGQVRRLSTFHLNSGNYLLRLNDVAFPVALQQGSAIVTHDGAALALANAANPEMSFNVAVDASLVDVFAFAKPATTENAGSYRVDVRPNGGSVVFGTVQAVGAGTTAAYAFPGEVTTAGNYRARLGDFAFPVALGSAHLAVVQDGSVLGRTEATATGPVWSLDVANVAAGNVTVIAVARPGTPGTGSSLAGGTFGVELAPAGGGALVVDATQGVGALISVRKVNIAQAGRYDMTVSDLNFPAPFSDLMAVVSRGAVKVGTLLVGSGTGGSPQGGIARLLDIEATVGDYAITLVAQPGATQGAAAYGISFVPAPPPPTVTLTAAPTAVAAGGSTTLTWTSQGADSCTASSSPSGTWIGSKVLSGSEAITPITAAITFTLRCTGTTGRSTEQTASVTIQTANNNGGGRGGGGGALGGLFVAMLLVAGAASSGRRMRRRAATQSGRD